MEKRIEKLEKRTGAGKQVVIWVHYVGDDTQPTEAQKEVAIANYKAKSPDRKEGDYIVLYWKNGQFEPPRSDRRCGRPVERIEHTGELQHHVNFVIGKGYQTDEPLG